MPLPVCTSAVSMKEPDQVTVELLALQFVHCPALVCGTSHEREPVIFDQRGFCSNFIVQDQAEMVWLVLRMYHMLGRGTHLRGRAQVFQRYAVFYTPTGPLADFGASWLGWDSALGSKVQHPETGTIDCAAVTATPRRYGLHSTLKAPFHLAGGADLDSLQDMAASFAAHTAAVEVGTVALRHANGFVALRPVVETLQLRDFAAATVRTFDSFRAPLSDDDIARRRKARLTARQDAQMLEFGYPYIFEDYHFHLTLSGRVAPDQGAHLITALSRVLAGLVPQPFTIDAITLMGEDSAGLFHQIHRYALTG
jgi:hypothetical protein